MDLRIELQRRGIAQPALRPGDSPDLTARGATDPRGETHPPTKPASGAPAPGAASSSGAGAGALFDANGDGVIESWSISHGGDSFATFTPPPPQATEPAPRRRSEAPAPPGASSPDRPDASPGTTAAIFHAHAAYKRDGLSNAPVTAGSGAKPPAPPVATPSPAPAPTNVPAGSGS